MAGWVNKQKVDGVISTGGVISRHPRWVNRRYRKTKVMRNRGSDEDYEDGVFSLSHLLRKTTATPPSGRSNPAKIRSVSLLCATSTLVAPAGMYLQSGSGAEGCLKDTGSAKLGE